MGISMFKWIGKDLWMLKNNGKQILIFELIYKLTATAIVYPLAILIMNLLLKAAGVRYLTNEYILQTFVSPFTLFIIVLLIYLFVLYSTYEMAFLSSCFELKRQAYSVTIVETGWTALRRMKQILNIRNIPLILFCFISILTVNITVLYHIVLNDSIAGLLKRNLLHSEWYVKLGITAVILLIYAFVIAGIFSFNIFVLEKKSFRQSYKESCKLVKKHLPGTIFSLAGYNIAVLAVIGVIYIVISAVLIAGVKILDMAYLGSALYLSVLKNIRTGTKFLLIYIAVPASYTVITRMYYKYRTDTEIDYERNKFNSSDEYCINRTDTEIDYEPVRIQKRFFQRNRIICFSLLTISLILNVIYIVGSFNKNPFDKVAIFHETKITAHRGSSIDAPENTMAAFSRAIDDMADYIELDVQMTADGQLVVMHDSNAYRTSGVDANISDMTLYEVKQLDVGSYFGAEFAGEKVPTLREVLVLAHDKAMLNIEIKSQNGNTEIADKVVQLVKAYDAQDECVITSFNYDILKRVKELEPSIQVGYILSAAYGNFYSMSDVDFFSMNASFLSKRMVDAIHNSGKQVHVWTVNNETSIKNLTNKGVDNIITDDPVLARETIYSRNTSETLINMAKYVFDR